MYLIKEVKYLYNENKNTTEKKRKKLKTMYRPPILIKNSIVKYLFYKTIYQFNTILLKLATLLFTEIGKAIQKFIWKHKSLCIAKAILTIRILLEVLPHLTLSYSKTIIGIKTSGY